MAQEYHGRRAVVLGASGFLGGWLVRALQEAGARVVGVVRTPGSAAHLSASGIDAVQRDLLAPQLGEWLASLDADVIFNAVGYGVDRSERDESLAVRTNADFVRTLAEGVAALPARRHWRGARLVHTGSALEYGRAAGILVEDATVVPHTPYGETKLAGTLAVRDIARRTETPMLVARLFTVYGAGEHETRLLPTLLRAARADGDVSLSAGTQRRDFAAAHDVAEGLLRLAVAPVAPGTIVNLATGRLVAVRDFAEIAADVLGIARSRLRFGVEDVRSDEMAPAGVSVERLHAATGWSLPSDLHAGIAYMAAAGT